MKGPKYQGASGEEGMSVTKEAWETPANTLDGVQKGQRPCRTARDRGLAGAWYRQNQPRHFSPL